MISQSKAMEKILEVMESQSGVIEGVTEDMPKELKDLIEAQYATVKSSYKALVNTYKLMVSFYAQRVIEKKKGS